MTKKEYRDRLQKEIDALYEHLKEVPENDYVERGITIGKINGMYNAKILSYDID